MSNVSTADFGAVVLDDVGRWTITRAEIFLGCALQAWSHDWHTTRERYHEEFVAEEDESEWCLSVHVCRADATNRRVWQQSKLMASEVESYYSDSYELRNKRDDWISAFDTHTCWTDMQIVRDATGAWRPVH